MSFVSFEDFSLSLCIPAASCLRAAHRAYKKAKAKGRTGHTTRVVWGSPKVREEGETQKAGHADEEKERVLVKREGKLYGPG